VVATLRGERIAEGLASSFHGVKVPVVDKEGLAIGSGAELRGTVVLPPTHDGWQQYLELAPKERRELHDAAGDGAFMVGP
jgi:hypothetical protein